MMMSLLGAILVLDVGLRYDPYCLANNLCMPPVGTTLISIAFFIVVLLVWHVLDFAQRGFPANKSLHFFSRVELMWGFFGLVAICWILESSGRFVVFVPCNSTALFFQECRQTSNMLAIPLLLSALAICALIILKGYVAVRLIFWTKE
jgi:hypothetical protein